MFASASAASPEDAGSRGPATRLSVPASEDVAWLSASWNSVHLLRSIWNGVGVKFFRKFSQRLAQVLTMNKADDVFAGCCFPSFFSIFNKNENPVSSKPLEKGTLLKFYDLRSTRLALNAQVL